MGPRRRFTLVELMIVVAIVAILAVIAIPSFHEMQLRAKRAELLPNIDGLMTAEVAYLGAYDGFVKGGFFPAGDPGKAPRAWPASTDYDPLGWAPDGDVRGEYRASQGYYDSSSCDVAAGSYAPGIGLQVFGRCDVDGDNVNACAAKDFDNSYTLSSSSLLSAPSVY